MHKSCNETNAKRGNMLYSLLFFIVSALNQGENEIATKAIFGISFIFNIIISIAMLPINIRLTAQNDPSILISLNSNFFQH